MSKKLFGKTGWGFLKETAPKPIRVMIGVPCFGAQMYAETAMALVNAIAHRAGTVVLTIATSLLTVNRNTLWYEAVRRARRGEITHLLFMDADTAPCDVDWLEQLLREMQKHQAQVLGCVYPIKNASGDTTTARQTGDAWHSECMTYAELRDHPVTWTAPDLLVGTGLLLIDMRGAWCDKICFHIEDRIDRTPKGDFTVNAQSEDWHFCRQAKALGVDIWATMRIKLHHWGPSCWPSYTPTAADHTPNRNNVVEGGAVLYTVPGASHG